MKQFNINYDCASKNEIKTILDNNCHGDKIIFANPSKIPEHILYAKNNNIKLLTFDSFDEMNKIKLLYPKAQLIIRIKVDDSQSDLKFNTKYGVDINDVPMMLRYASLLELNVVGVSFHVGSRCKNTDVYNSALYLTRQVYDIALKYDYRLSIVDIGGGFPGYDDYAFRKMSMSIHMGIHEYFNKIKINFIAEPGRYFASSAYTIVAKVINRKIYTDKTIYYINEGVYGCFNNTLTDKEPIIINTLKSNDKLFNTTIFGPSCDSLDCIANNIKLPELEIGDYIYAENMGAYTVSCATNFNGLVPAKVKYILY
jgi:ornithine decarboxylase